MARKSSALPFLFKVGRWLVLLNINSMKEPKVSK